MNKKLYFPMIALGVALSVGLATFATVSHASTSPVSQESETLAAQINVTRDQISQLVSKLKTSPGGSTTGFSHPDFIAKSRELNSRIEKAMVEFEANLADDVFRPASLWMDRLKKIETDPSYDTTQRNALFKDQYQQATVAFKSISEKYKATILKLYMSVLPAMEIRYRTYEATPTSSSRSCSGTIGRWELHNCYQVKINLDLVSKDPRIPIPTLNFWKTVDARSDFNSANSVEEITGRFQNATIYDSPVGVLPDVHTAIYEGFVKTGCMSSSCVTLFSSQLTSFVSLVWSSLDKSIPFKVGTGSLTLEPLSLNRDYALRYVSIPTDQVNNLPFDIQEAPYRQALVEKAAVAYANSEVTTCQGEGDQLKALACFSNGGCFNEAEKSYIEAAIQNSKTWWNSSRAKKIACLRN